MKYIVIILCMLFQINEQIDVLAARMDVEGRKKFYRGVELDPLRYICLNGAQEEYIHTVANSVNDSKIPVIL